MSKSAGTARADTDKIREANEEFRNRTLLDRNLDKLRRTDPAAYEARVKAIREEVKTELGIEPTAQPATMSAAPAAKPAAPSAKPAAGGKVMTMADVQATAKANNKTEAEVIAAAKAKGFIIQ
jgi:cell division septation protein DedD